MYHRLKSAVKMSVCIHRMYINVIKEDVYAYDNSGHVEVLY